MVGLPCTLFSCSGQVPHALCPHALYSHAQAKFLTHYVHTGILPQDPFETLDEDGVGEMVRRGRG